MGLPLLVGGCEMLLPRDAPPTAAPAPAPAPAVRPAPVAQPAVPIPAAKPPVPAAAVGIATDNHGQPLVIGLNREGLVRQFGGPVAEREAPPARVLEFGPDDCRLAAYLYFDTARNDFYTLQYEVNGSVDRDAAASRCLQRIARDAARR